MNTDAETLDNILLHAGLRVKYETFMNACKTKMLVKAKRENRSLQPWKDHDKEFLTTRLKQEVVELYHEFEGIRDTKKIQDELLDVANFAFFLWTKLEGE